MGPIGPVGYSDEGFEEELKPGGEGLKEGPRDLIGDGGGII